MEEIDQNPRVTRKISNIFSGNVFKTRILIVLMSKRYLKISRVFRKNLLKLLKIEIIILLGCHDQILRIWRNSFDYCLLFLELFLTFHLVGEYSHFHADAKQCLHDLSFPDCGPIVIICIWPISI